MSKLNCLHHLLLTTFDLWLDVLRFIKLSLQPNWALAAENLFLRKQLALYLDRKVKPHRATDATRLTLLFLSRLFAWATGSDNREAGHLDPVSSARLSVVVEVEIEAARTAPSPDRSPQTDREDG